MLSLADRALGYRLGLGDLQLAPTCHGYACGCLCAECVARATQPAPPSPDQPWVPKVQAA